MAFNFTDVPAGVDLSESRTASNNAIGIVLFVLSLIFVALRLVVRLRMKHEPLGLDDYLMFVGLVLNAGNLACCIAGGFYGLGKHIWSLTQYQMRQISIVRESSLLFLLTLTSADHFRICFHICLERVHHQIFDTRLISTNLWTLMAWILLRGPHHRLSVDEPHRVTSLHVPAFILLGSMD
jgi:hypothetical protein